MPQNLSVRGLFSNVQQPYSSVSSPPAEATASCPTEKPPHKRRSRRMVLKGLVTGGLALVGWTTVVEPVWLEVVQHKLVVPNLPRTWIGRRLIHVSDLHVGQVSQSHLRAAMQNINQLKPDVLVITGDFMDRHHLVDDRLDAVLEILNPPRIAALACLGNHDFGQDWSDLSIADKITEVVQKHGIRVLRNEIVDIDGVDFSGLEDCWSPLFAPRPVLNLANADKPSICLCHNPDVYDLGDWSLFRGVILSGHTHGGQCKPPFLPPPLLPVSNRRYTSGFIGLSEGHQMYISRGVGYSMRVRFNCRPEITVFDLG